MFIALFKNLFTTLGPQTQRDRDEAYLAESTDLLDLEHRQQELDRRHLDQRPLLWHSGPRIH
jgi:hypothetical protein